MSKIHDTALDAGLPLFFVLVFVHLNHLQTLNKLHFLTSPCLYITYYFWNKYIFFFCPIYLGATFLTFKYQMEYYLLFRDLHDLPMLILMLFP